MEDIDSGMIFQSDIPLAYGLGISGALTAAVYERYFDPVVLPEPGKPSINIKCVICPPFKYLLLKIYHLILSQARHIIFQNDDTKEKHL